MKLFHFYRIEDHSGVSGTGPVVEGVQFTNGWCALRWVSSQSSLCFYQSLEDVKKIHGHGGKTEIILHDLEPLRRMGRKATTPNTKESLIFESLVQIVDETSRIMTLSEDPEPQLPDMQTSVIELRRIIDRIERHIIEASGGSNERTDEEKSA